MDSFSASILNTIPVILSIFSSDAERPKRAMKIVRKMGKQKTSGVHCPTYLSFSPPNRFPWEEKRSLTQSKLGLQRNLICNPFNQYNDSSHKSKNQTTEKFSL